MGADLSVDGLIQAINPEAGINAEDVRAFFDRHAAEARQPIEGEYKQTAAEFRRAKAELNELRALKANLGADRDNLTSELEAARAKAAEADDIRQQFESVKAEAAKHAALAQRWQQSQFQEVIRSAGGITDPDYVPAIVGRLGLSPTFNDDGTPVLSDADQARLKAFLEEPANRRKYVDGQSGAPRLGMPGVPTTRNASADGPMSRVPDNLKAEAERFRQRYSAR